MEEDAAAYPLSYDTISELFVGSGLSISAAELHGVVAGLACIPGDPGTEWIKELVNGLDEDALSSEQAMCILIQLFMETQQQFNLSGFSFRPLLPSDDVPLGERSTALGHWCAGFLFGLNYEGRSNLDELTKDSQEVISDLASFAKIRSVSQTDEAEELAYTELVEYIRVGVMLLNEELFIDESQVMNSTVH